MDDTANSDGRPRVEVGVIEIRDVPGEWLVEAVDHGSEGEIYRTIFAGPKARELVVGHFEFSGT